MLVTVFVNNYVSKLNQHTITLGANGTILKKLYLTQKFLKV